MLFRQIKQRALSFCWTTKYFANNSSLNIRPSWSMLRLCEHDIFRIKLPIFETKLQFKLLLLWTAKPILLLSSITNGAGYDASRTVSHRDLSWRPFSSTSTSPTCQPPSPESSICWRPSNHACWWRLAGSGRGAEQGYGNARWKSTDLEAKAQHHENGVGGLPSHQQGSQMRAESQLQQRNPTLLLRAHIPRSNVGQVRHVSPTPWVTSQEANITRRTPEAACWFRLGCWSNNAENSHPCPGPFDSRVQRSCLVPQCSYPPHRPRHQRRLANCDWMPASYTSRQSSNPRKNPTCWASSQWSHTISRTPCHGVWTPAPLSAHPSIWWSCTAPQIETPICTRRTTTHQCFWQQQQHTCGAVGGQPHKTPHFISRHRYPTPLESPSQEQLGSGLTASAPLSDVSAPACTNGVCPPLRSVSVAQINRPSTMLSSNVQSIDLPTAWRFEWSNRWDNEATDDDETTEWLLTTCPDI